MIKKAKRKKVMVTLDLDSKANPNYRRLNELMTDLGFSKLSPKKGISFPHNTYYGITTDKIAHFRASLWQELKNNNLHPKALFGGELKDWAAKREKK
jgi:hypothetical protein